MLSGSISGSTRNLLRSKGFTLIELMVVVAIIGVLASLAITMFGSEQKKINAKSEVSAMFAEFKMRQEQYRLENGVYLSSNSANDEGVTWPAAPNGTGGKNPLSPQPTEWNNLHLTPDAASVACAYVSIAGKGGESANIGTKASSSFSFTAPPTDWYYILARCDMDQDSAVDAYYFQNSGSSELFYINEGN